MDYQTALALALPFGLALAAIGSGLGLGKAVAAAMDAMGRQPEAAGKIQALTIYALVAFFILQGRIGQ